MIAEERRDRRQTSDVGRKARLELVFAREGGRTTLVHGYAEPPFRVGRTFQWGSDGLHLIMASSAPGAFGGDDLEQHIRLEAGARVRLTSQSALQIHPDVEASPAGLRSVYRIGEGAELSCHWDAMIPFTGARFAQQIEMALGAGARLFWSDAFAAGRTGRGEAWAFDSLAYELRLEREGRLEYLERYRIDPADRRPDVPWLAGGAHRFGSALVCVPADAAIAGRDGGIPRPSKEDVEACHLALQDIPGVRAAVDLVEPGLVVARIMADSGVPFHEARERFARLGDPAAEPGEET